MTGWPKCDNLDAFPPFSRWKWSTIRRNKWKISPDSLRFKRTADLLCPAPCRNRSRDWRRCWSPTFRVRRRAESWYLSPRWPATKKPNFIQFNQPTTLNELKWKKEARPVPPPPASASFHFQDENNETVAGFVLVRWCFTSFLKFIQIYSNWQSTDGCRWPVSTSGKWPVLLTSR